MFEQIEQLLTDAQDVHILGAALLSNWLLDEVSPPDETALARQFFSPSSEGLENHSTGAGDDWTDQNKGPSGDDSSRESVAISGIESFPAGAKRRGLREGDEVG